jgi:uncharacterized protein YerC
MASRAAASKSTPGSAPVTPEEVASAAQQVQVQQSLAVMLLQAATFAHAQCTSTSSSKELSNKEKRCINQTVAGYVQARAFIGQALTSQQKAEGRDF